MKCSMNLMGFVLLLLLSSKGFATEVESSKELETKNTQNSQAQVAGEKLEKDAVIPMATSTPKSAETQTVDTKSAEPKPEGSKPEEPKTVDSKLQTSEVSDKAKPAEKSEATDKAVNSEKVQDADKTEKTNKVDTAEKTESADSTNKNENPSEGRSFGRIGPMFTLSFPRIKEISLEYLTVNKMFSFALSKGGISIDPATNISATFSNFDIRGRWHPFMGSFFLGAGYGSQSITIEGTETINSITAHLKEEVTSTYFMPQLGWLSVWDIGLTMGFELGTIIPSGVSTNFTSDAPALVKATSDYKKLKEDAESTGNKLGASSIPYIALFRIGWLF